MKSFESQFNQMFNPVITAEIKQSIIGVWNAIASDVCDVEDNESAIEMCIDANRLTSFGYANEDKAVSELIGQFGYAVVLKALAKEVQIV